MHARNGQRKIQVEHFPPLTSVRQSNGAWQLENMHVILQQTQNIEATKLPLFDVEIDVINELTGFEY